jgi:DNA mismatch endonuclease (patch repair protein)
MPKSRVDFWMAKFERNVARDRRVCRELKKMGWAVMVVWQCELKDLQQLSQRIEAFFS